MIAPSWSPGRCRPTCWPICAAPWTRPLPAGRRWNSSARILNRSSRNAAGPAGRAKAPRPAWRTRVIYETNLFTSYSAGRTQQMKDVAASRPWWRYRHSDASVHPCKEHRAWSRKILHADDPWWATHTPPNGWGCKCYLETLADHDLEQHGLTPTSPEKIPFPDSGIDKCWDYPPGASVAEELAQFAKNKSTTLALADPAAQLAKDYVATLVRHPQFQRFFAGELPGEYPLAVLDAELRQAMDVLQPVVVLSQETVEAHRHHPEAA
ncbi:MAG TPA: phage minor head protein [Candidatus Competibacteraceae bacterium]|nr:phage minor head protein [Candidatus Competibacteraceae bacterium]HRZ05459.1 phage minor head protein [Candidatus Competibacteraceae bacterium]HSA45953.1 phage minor head protein [Candidatus Competibacteraceae bacterium]